MMSKTTYCSHWQSEAMIRLGFRLECQHYPKEKKVVVTLPTVETAAKFLREELGADLVVSPEFNSKTGDRIGYFWRWSQRTDKIDNKTYRTFEAALSAGISVVLEPFKEYFNENP